MERTFINHVMVIGALYLSGSLFTEAYASEDFTDLTTSPKALSSTQPEQTASASRLALYEQPEHAPVQESLLQQFYRKNSFKDASEIDRNKVAANLAKIPTHDRRLFADIFGPMVASLSFSRGTDKAFDIENLAKLPTHDWYDFYNFMGAFFNMVEPQSTATSEPSLLQRINQIFCTVACDERIEYPFAWTGMPYSRALSHLVHIAPTDRRGFLEFMWQNIEPTMKADDISWLVAGLRRVPPTQRDFATEQWQKLFSNGVTPYEKSLVFKALGSLESDDSNAVDYARQLFTNELSYEHRAALVHAFGRMKPEGRQKMLDMVNELSKGKDHNYHAWVLQMLGFARDGDELDELKPIIEASLQRHINYPNAYSDAAKWRSRKNKQLAEAAQ